MSRRPLFERPGTLPGTSPTFERFVLGLCAISAIAQVVAVAEVPGAGG
jgi:hypothetical protein